MAEMNFQRSEPDSPNCFKTTRDFPDEKRLASLLYSCDLTVAHLTCD